MQRPSKEKTTYRYIFIMSMSANTSTGTRCKEKKQKRPGVKTIYNDVIFFCFPSRSAAFTGQS